MQKGSWPQRLLVQLVNKNGSSGFGVLGPPMNLWPSEDNASIYMGDQSGLGFQPDTGHGPGTTRLVAPEITRRESPHPAWLARAISPSAV